METYAEAAKWAHLPNSPTADELKPAFKQAYKENLTKYPCFRNDPALYSSRQWWFNTVERTLQLCSRSYSSKEFDRFFRRVYQHYGSSEGYELLPDTIPFLNYLREERPDICLGITTNTPIRSIETVLPMMGIHDRFKFFVCCQDVG
jgi:FMN phosphatase YigB (HAD superfamily)